MARTMTAPKPAPTAVTTGGTPGGLQALRNLLDMYGRPASEMSPKERSEAITGYELKQRIEALVRGITGKKINHIYAGSGAATAPGMMLLPRIAGTMLFSPREVYIILGYTAHELAHQLHTDFGLVESIFADLEKPTTREQQVKEFWNGIEDYRIERESRKRYPGFPVLINETRDHTARRFVEQVDAGLIPPAGLANAYRIGSVALTWIGARLNNYATQAPAEALMRVPDPLRSWLESWDAEMAAVVTCEDARDLAIRILDEIDRMRTNPSEEEDDPNQEGDEGEKGPCDKKSGTDQDNPSNDPSQGGDGDEASESEPGKGGKSEDSDQEGSDPGTDGDEGDPTSGNGKGSDAGEDDGDPKKNGAGGESDEGDPGDEDTDQGGPSESDGETDKDRDGNGGKNSDDAGDQDDSEADDGKGVGSGGPEADEGKDEGGQSEDGDGKKDADQQGDSGAEAGQEGQSSDADGGKDGSTEAGADGQSEGEPGAEKDGSADSGNDQGGQAGDAEDGGTDGAGNKDGDPAKDDGDRKEGDGDGEESDAEGGKEEGGSRPTPPPVGGSAGSGSGQDAGDPGSGAMAKDAGDSGEAGGDGAGPSKPMPQNKPERRDIHVPEGDQDEKAEEADLAIDELIEAINEACQGMTEAETPEIHDPKTVAASDGDQDFDDYEADDDGIEQHQVKKTGTEKYTMLRQQLSSAAARTAGVVRRMLQSRNRTRTRSGLEDGHLDFGRLVPMAMGSSDVYRQTRSTPQINTALTLLLDNSGSMSGHPLRLCQQTAIVLDMSVQGTPTALEILGFTSGFNGTRIYQYRTFEQKGVSSAASLGNMDSVELGGTPVGTPVMEAWRRLRQRKEPRKIMIVVSDGGAQDPVEALAAARIVEMQGGTVVGIAIGAEEYMKKWCEKVVPIQNVEELPQALAQIVQEHLSR